MRGCCWHYESLKQKRKRKEKNRVERKKAGKLLKAHADVASEKTYENDSAIKISLRHYYDLLRKTKEKTKK